MRSLAVSDPLVGSVLSYPTRWPGTLKLEQAASELQFQYLQQHPGVDYRETKYDTGWFVGASLLDMGRYAGELMDYPPEIDRTIPLLNSDIKEYQARTVSFLRQVNKYREGAILASDMGLRKTGTTLHALYLDGYLTKPGLVCGPAIAEETWCSTDGDPYKFYGLTIQKLRGKKNIAPEMLQWGGWFYCNYSILQAWAPWIFAILKPHSVIFDEGHNLLNGGTQRYKAAKDISLCHSVERRYVLTGTPIGNKRYELWGLLSIAQPRQWSISSGFSFGVKFCAGQLDEKSGHWGFDGESNDFELRARLAGTMLRYTRYDPEVASQLPKMQRVAMEAEGIDPLIMNEYQHARSNIIDYLKDKGKVATESQRLVVGNNIIELSANDQKPAAIQLVCITELISILSRMKQDPAIRATEKILQKHDRVVVFTWRVEAAKYISDQLKQIRTSIPGQPKIFGPVTGETPRSKRKEFAKRLAESERGVYVATRGSAGVAINDLVCASACLMVDLHWTTISLVQAEARIHRDGSKASEIEIYYLIVPKTIDQKMLEALQTKASAISSIAPKDDVGLSLARDLSPSGGKEVGADLDAICASLMSDDFTTY